MKHCIYKWFCPCFFEWQNLYLSFVSTKVCSNPSLYGTLILAACFCYTFLGCPNFFFVCVFACLSLCLIWLSVFLSVIPYFKHCVKLKVKTLTVRHLGGTNGRASFIRYNMACTRKKVASKYVGPDIFSKKRHFIQSKINSYFAIGRHLNKLSLSFLWLKPFPKKGRYQSKCMF